MRKFIASLFSRNDNPSDIGLVPSAKSYLKEKNVKEIIYATSVFSDMDYSVITGSVSQIIGVVEEHEDGEQVKQSLQYYYYRYLFHHFFLNSKQAMEAAKILNIEIMDANDLSRKWPTTLSYEKYLELYNFLKLDLVSRVNINSEAKNKFIVVLNPLFWDYEIRDTYNLLIDVTSTYERDFSKSDWIFDNEDDALNFGIITFEKLCNDRGPDNSYYYSELIAKQIDLALPGDKEELKAFGLTAHSGLPRFTRENHKDLPWSKSDIDTVAAMKKAEFTMVKTILSKIPTPPFYIIHGK